jgi:hypothetical protein
MITSEMYDNHDLPWSAKQKSIGVQPRLPLLTTHSRSYSRILNNHGNGRFSTRTPSRRRQNQVAKVKRRFAAAPNCWHRGSGHKKLPFPDIHLFGESRTMDVRWVSMQMHLSLIMPNPGHATVATCSSFRWLLCGRVLEARKL